MGAFLQVAMQQAGVAAGSVLAFVRFCAPLARPHIASRGPLPWALRIVVVTATSIVLATCAQTPPRFAARPDPSDPHAPARATAYRPVLGNYVSQRPAEPAAPATNQ
jgi:hypothetical protein